MSVKPIYLKDYTPPDYQVEEVELTIELGETSTLVNSKLKISKSNPGSDKSLRLDGEHLQLKRIALNGISLSDDNYRLTSEYLSLNNLPDSFELAIETEIKPQENTTLEGLYKSSGNFCTQCEPHGFRRITYYIDRPDVMARFTTKIIADKERYPILLSNGNLLASQALANNRHSVIWHDPFKKPCYLFALVAGRLDFIEDSFVTCSGREIKLRIFTENGQAQKALHAMQALKLAMRWDEEVYGREYDLDIFMIVAVSDFNMGAMENKGLNIFNSKYILVDPQTATDTDYEGVETVISHEYFHNWTGNRITCRDWFQLSLKEGLTVFRDQEFTADVTSRAVTRINDVKVLRASQFAQDASPLAHPVRPDSYIEINNFYTVTVYNKGAEVVRMLHTLLGSSGFHKGMDLYFSRHDGQAVTTDDFVQAMQDANHFDLTQFKRWYSQAGTPEVTVEEVYDETEKVYTLTLKQTIPATPGQPTKLPMHIPIRIGLLDNITGEGIPLCLEGEGQIDNNVLSLKESVSSWRFVNVPHKPVVSLLQGFSAPVKLHKEYSSDELCFLLAHDNDDFNRWEAGQRLAMQAILSLIERYRQGQSLVLDEKLIDAYRQVLLNQHLDPALKALILSLPSETYIGAALPAIDVDAILRVRRFVRQALAEALQEDLAHAYNNLNDRRPYRYTASAVARRSLKNICLAYLNLIPDFKAFTICFEQFTSADNMTDALAALSCIVNLDHPDRMSLLNDFYRKWQHDRLVVDKWFALQANSELPDTFNQVKNLLQHPAFEIKNPNRIRSLIGTFSNNFVAFHRKDGISYAFLAGQVLILNELNPLVAARLLEPLTHWQRFIDPYRSLMQQQLQRIAGESDLSKDVYELVIKSLESS